MKTLSKVNEYEKGEYIEITEKDFESIAIESTKVIQHHRFCI